MKKMQSEANRLYWNDSDTVPLYLLGFVIALTFGIVVVFHIIN